MAFPATNERFGRAVPSNTIEITSLRNPLGLKLVLLGPGRRWLKDIDHNYLNKSIDLNLLQKTGLFEFRDEQSAAKSDTLTIVRVNEGEYGFALEDGKPVTLDAGWHIRNSSQFAYICSIDKVSGEITKQSELHKSTIDPAQIVKRFPCIQEAPVPTKALVKRPEPTNELVVSTNIVKKSPAVVGTSLPTQPQPPLASIRTGGEGTSVHFDSMQEIIIPLGYIGLAFDNQKPIFYHEGIHDVSNQVKLTGTVPANFKVFQHGNLIVFQVQPGEIAVGTTNGTSELFGPGIYVRDMIAERFELEAITQDSLLEHDIVSKTLTMTRVPPNCVRLAQVNANPLMLGPGIHHIRSSATKLDQIESQTLAEFSQGSLHVRRVQAGEWGVAEFSNGLTELLEPGVHVIRDPAFKWIESIPQNLTKPYSHGNLHLIPVPLGKIALVTINNRAVVLGSSNQGTLHCIDSPLVVFDRYEDIYNDAESHNSKPHIIKHGENVTIADIPNGYVAFGMNGPMLEEIHSGIYAWDSPQFKFHNAASLTDKLIKKPNGFTYSAIVDTGEVGVYYHDGILGILTPKKYGPESQEFKDKNIVFAGWLSTAREQFKEPLELTVNTAETTSMSVLLNMEYQILPEDAEKVISMTRSSLSGDAGIGRDTTALAQLIEKKIKTSALTTLSSIMKEVRYANFVGSASNMDDRTSDRAITAEIDKTFGKMFSESLKQAGITLTSSSLFKFIPENAELRKKYHDQISTLLDQRQQLQRQELAVKIATGQQATAEAEARVQAIKASSQARTEAEIQILNAERDAKVAVTQANQTRDIEIANAEQKAKTAATQAEQAAATAITAAKQAAEVEKAKAEQSAAIASSTAEQDNIRATKTAERSAAVSLIEAKNLKEVAQLKFETAQLEAQTKKLEAETELAIAQSKVAQQKLSVEVGVLEYRLKLEADTAAKVNFFKGLSEAMTPELAAVFQAKYQADAVQGLNPSITVSDQSQFGAYAEVISSAMRGTPFWQTTTPSALSARQTQQTPLARRMQQAQPTQADNLLGVMPDISVPAITTASVAAQQKEANVVQQTP